jgi:O-succinylbenzoic acid--CoA ligase
MTNASYFQPGVFPVGWEDRETVVLANPEWVRRQPGGLGDVNRRLPALEAHVWVSTSGSSGDAPDRLRWVALSKEAFLASARAVNAHLSATASDIWAHALPVFHVGGLGILARGRLSGSQVVAAVSERWSAAEFRTVVAQSRATLTALVPSQVHDLVAAGLDAPPSLRAIVVGGARLEPALYAAARALGWPCLPSYGLTETCSQVATAGLSSLASLECPTVLPVLSHAEIRADEDGRLSIRAASLLTCCVEVDGDKVRAWDPKRDGWFETDDTGRVSDVGVEVLGRVSEFVKVLGEKVSLQRVEDQVWRWAEREGLCGIGGFDLGVVGIPHPRLGVELVAALASGLETSPARREALTASLDACCREALLPFERIHRVAWVDAIPRTALGKVQRALLCREVGEGLQPLAPPQA